MHTPPIINLYETLEEALQYKNSWVNEVWRFNGVQLLPNNPIKYIQATNTPNGIELEDWLVNVVDLCIGVKTDITDSFFVEALINSDNGDPQIVWSLQNIPFDNKVNLVYLEITQVVGQIYYSTPFLLTEYQKDKTTLLHYKQNRLDWYQSIQMRAWFRQPTKQTELTTYYQTSTQNTVSQAIKVNRLELYFTELMNLNLLILLSNVLESPYLYVNLVRGYLFEAIEIPTLDASQAFGETNFLISPNTRDVLDLDNLSPPILPTPIPIPTTIDVILKPIRYSGGGFLRVQIKINITDGYTSLDTVNSYVNINNAVYEPPYVMTPLVLLSGSEYGTQSALISQIGTASVNIDGINLITSNGVNNKVFNILDANITFTNTEIDNGTEKSLTLNIL